MSSQIDYPDYCSLVGTVLLEMPTEAIAPFVKISGNSALTPVDGGLTNEVGALSSGTYHLSINEGIDGHLDGALSQRKPFFRFLV